MIIEPTIWATLLPLLLITGGGGLCFTLIIFTNKGKFAIPIMVGIFVITLIVLFGWSYQMFDNYTAQVTELINTADCNDLPNVAHDYPIYRSQVVDEVVLRCLVNNPQLSSFVMENRT